MATVAFGQTRGKSIMSLPFARPEELLECGHGLYRLIAQRAYQLYEARGRADGQDITDWLQAESEIVSPCRHNMVESRESVTFRIDLPGVFSADQVSISVELRRLLFCAQREIEITYSGTNGTVSKLGMRRLFHIQNLPAEVDPSRSKATLSFETLEITMPKHMMTPSPQGCDDEKQDTPAPATLRDQNGLLCRD